MTDKPTREEVAAAAAHDPRGCHQCMNPDLHGDQAEDEETRELFRLQEEVERLTRFLGGRRTLAACDGIDITILRRLLWLRHGCVGLYGDDGEMQCGNCGIDFKRSEPEEIEARFQQIGLSKLAEATPLLAQVATLTAERDRLKASNEGIAASLEAQVEGARAFAQRAARDEAAEIAYGMADDWTCPNCNCDTAHDLASEIDHAIRARDGKRRGAR